MEKYILITGALGFIGSHTCVELLNKNYNVIGIDNLSNSKLDVKDKIEIITKKSIIFYNYDLLNISDIELIFLKYKIECVIHFAGLKSVNESTKIPLHYYNVNLQTTINLLTIMSKYNCKNIIFSSSCTVYGTQKSPVNEQCETGKNITNPYGRSKYMQEEIMKDLYISDKSWSITLLRYFNPIGCHQSGIIGEDPNDIPNNLFPIILKNAIGIYPILNIYGSDYDTSDGTCVRDFIHVVDLANGHLCALKNINKNGVHIYNLGTGKGTSVLELVTAFEITNNKKLNYTFVAKREGDLDCVYADTNKANDELDFLAKKTIYDMCRDGWNYMMKNFHLS